MTQRFNKKTVIITGGGSGIGQTAAIRFASEGAHVVILDLDMAGAESTQKAITLDGGTASVYECNVGNAQQVNDVVASVLKENKIDILINNAGIAHIGNLETTEEEDLDRIYQVNVKGCYNMMKAVIGSMKENKSGVILNLASVASSVGIADRFAYSMSKGAVLTMTYSVAKDYISDGIRCNCIAPGRVHTPFVDNFLEKNYPNEKEEMFEKLSKSQPIGRMGKVDEIAGLIVYLCSDEAAFITGSNFPVDGGFVTLNN
ncbi:SDR family oxidoreductase [Pseudocolwellia sp. AS88]|uniref:SDR family NAD(P)-dependent oxidoreductase n=1 Tax=Pseudocolwellia sp. AS88 TaxID=3063958 RepID=UPI0026F0490D|nr:SDR family oxidoreductase [Pseudocolwellia sp. AS88]MDO7085514.1 SDR family oxidoreductase [Pseudocolwellia sp. AS88]